MGKRLLFCRSLILLFVFAFMGFKDIQQTPKKSSTSTKPEGPVFTGEPQDTFPVPAGNPNQLFYIQRTTNINTIVYELNYNSNGVLNEEEPVHVFWIKYAEDKQRHELSYIQRVFAYGVKSQPLGNGSYKLHLVSYKKQALYLMISPKDKKYHIYTTMNQKEMMLNRIFAKVEGGTFWVPNVVYIEMKGYDPNTFKEVKERFKP
jgi:hypothetical protein